MVGEVEMTNGHIESVGKGLDQDLDQLKEQIKEINKDMDKEVSKDMDQGINKEEEGFKCLNKALEIPLVSGLTSSVYATTEYISSTRPANLVSEKIKTVGQREDVKNVLTSVTTLYENNVSDRVQELRNTLNPTLKNLDDYACTSIDLVNDKVTETKEVYVDPMVNKLNETTEAYKNKLNETREAFVDPVVEKVNNLKEQTTKVVSDYTESAVNMKSAYVDPAIEKVATVKTTYVDPAIETASKVKTSYVDPAIETASKVKTSYVDPAISAAYSAVEDPKKAYGEAVTYGKDVITVTKDVAINKAINTMDSTKEYLLKAKDTSLDQMQSYVNDAKESVRITSRKSLERAVSFTRQMRDNYIKKTAELMLAAQAAAYAKLHEQYPTVADLVDRGINRITTTTQILFQATKTTVTVTVDSTRKVVDTVGSGVTWTKESYSATKEAIVDTTDKVAEYGTEFTKTNEENIRYLANVAGLSSYLGFIGLDLKEKTM